MRSAGNQSPFDLGWLVLRPGISYSYGLTTGVQYAPGRTANTVVQVVSPDLDGELGHHWTFRYTPAWTYYSSGAFHDALNQSASLAGSYNIDDWSVQLSQAANVTDLPSVVTGTQTRQSVYQTAASASRRLADQWETQGQLSQMIQSSGGSAGNGRSWSGQESVLYDADPRLAYGASAGVVYSEVVGSLELLQLTPQLQATWHATDMTTIAAHFGGMSNQVLKGPKGHATSTTGGLSLHRAPKRGLAFDLSADRVQSISFLTDQLVTSNDLTARLGGVLINHYSLSAMVEQQWNRYAATPALGAIPALLARSDRTFDAGATFGVQGLFKRGALNLGYQFTRQSSSLGALSQSPQTWTLSVMYHY